MQQFHRRIIADGRYGPIECCHQLRHRIVVNRRNPRSARQTPAIQRRLRNGQVQVRNFTAPALQPLELQWNWEGKGLGLRRSDLVVRAGKSSLEFRGSVATTNRAANLLIEALTLQQNRQAVLELQNPTRLSLRRASGTNTQAPIWAARLEPLHWLGTNRELRLEGDVSWPRSGRLDATLRSLDFSLVSDFLNRPLQPVKLVELKAATDWSNGPANVSLELSATLTNKTVPFSVQARLKGDGGGLTLANLAVSSQQDQQVFTARGFLPLVLNPAEPRPIHFLPGQSLELHAASEPDSPFWVQFAALTGLAVREPSS